MYNEETIAKLSIETILEYTKKLPPIVTVVVVNDGSKDATENILRDLMGRYKENEFRLISHFDNRGYGSALRTGIKFAITHKYDYLLFMDGDLTNHPKYLELFYEKMLDGWEYIKASRYAVGGDVEGVPLRHRIISRIGNSVARALYGLPLKDLTNGFRAAKVDIFKKIHLKESGFAIIMEELSQVKYLTNSFCEIPYVLTSRKIGQGKTCFSYNLVTSLQYLKYSLKSFFKGKNIKTNNN